MGEARECTICKMRNECKSHYTWQPPTGPPCYEPVGEDTKYVPLCPECKTTLGETMTLDERLKHIAECIKRSRAV